MKIQETVSARFGKKFGKLQDLVAALDNSVIALGDTAQSESIAREFDKEYKYFAKLAAKLAALVGA